MGTATVTGSAHPGVHWFEPPLNPDGVPEHFMGVGGIQFDGDETTAVVNTGPWLSWGGRDVTLGSLGVWFDNVLAYPMIRGSSDQTSLVSTQITIDELSPIRVDAGPLAARGTLLGRDQHAAFATAELRNADGVLVAVGTQRGRFIPYVDPPNYNYQTVPEVTTSSTLADLMWLDDDPPNLDQDGRFEIAVSRRLGNHMDNMHGGISLLLAEWSAIAAARAAGSDLTPASIRITYARPIPVGTTATFETYVLHVGRTTATVNVVARTAAGRCGVAATVTLH